LFSSHPKRERDREVHLNYYASTYNTGRQLLHCKTKQQQQQPFYGPLSGTTRVSRYHQKKHSPTHHPDHPIFISFFHLLQSLASSLFKLHAWQSLCTTSLHVLFGLTLGLGPSTSYSIHFLTQSVSSFRSTCPHHRSLFCCSINIISSTFTFTHTHKHARLMEENPSQLFDLF